MSPSSWIPTQIERDSHMSAAGSWKNTSGANGNWPNRDSIAQKMTHTGASNTRLLVDEKHRRPPENGAEEDHVSGEQVVRPGTLNSGIWEYLRIIWTFLARSGIAHPYRSLWLNWGMESILEGRIVYPVHT